MKIETIKDPRLRARVEQALSDAQSLKEDVVKECAKPVKKRIRQSTKPLLNNLEEEFMLTLVPQFDEAGWIVVPQSIRFRLANGLYYKPDFLVIGQPGVSTMVGYEVKGPHAFRGGFENLKMAAHQYTWITWVLAWKDDGNWMYQTVLP